MLTKPVIVLHRLTHGTGFSYSQCCRWDGTFSGDGKGLLRFLPWLELTIDIFCLVFLCKRALDGRTI